MARILVVDDDKDMEEICSRLLPRKGHELLFADNAEDAVATALAEKPELILMDMRMPMTSGGAVDDRAGIAATKKIREDRSLDVVPIIALTGHIMSKFRESILEAGCADLLTKPIVDFSQLVDVIDAHLAKS